MKQVISPPEGAVAHWPISFNQFWTSQQALEITQELFYTDSSAKGLEKYTHEQVMHFFLTCTSTSMSWLNLQIIILKKFNCGCFYNQNNVGSCLIKTSSTRPT